MIGMGLTSLLKDGNGAGDGKRCQGSHMDHVKINAKTGSRISSRPTLRVRWFIRRCSKTLDMVLKDADHDPKE